MEVGDPVAEVSDVGQSVLALNQSGWSAVPNSIVRSKLSMAAKCVYMSLSSRINCGAGNWPSHALIAEESSCSIATVKRALVELRDAGVVEWRQRSDGKGGQTTNEYRLIVSPPFQQAAPTGVPF